MKYLIYALSDPRTDQIRYIGRSSNGLGRPSRHWKSKVERERKDPCHSWIRKLLSLSLFPQVDVLEEFPESDDVNLVLNDNEIFWIGYYRMIGCQLLNLSDGGGGLLNPPIEVRRKIALGNTDKSRPYSYHAKTCLTCGKEFQGRLISKCCSYSCSNRHSGERRRGTNDPTKWVQKSCLICGTQFFSYAKDNRITCSRSCQAQRWNERRIQCA